VPVKITVGQPQPVITPVTDYSTTTGTTPAIEILPTPVFNQPPNAVENCTPSKPDPEAKCRYDNLDIAGKCDDIQQLLDANLDQDYTANVQLAPCEEGPVIELNSTGRGVPGIDQKLDVLAQALNLVWDKVKCESTETLISISDSWEIRKEKNVGQLHIVCKKPGDKTSFRRNFSIPHSRITTEAEGKAIFTERRRYQRGSHLTRLILRDNSSIKLCVEDEFTGQNLMDWLVNNCLDTSWLETSGGEYRHTTNVKQEIISCEVELYSVAYYPTGKRGEIPAWQFVIPE
jgi:hypothetical protein